MRRISAAIAVVVTITAALTGIGTGVAGAITPCQTTTAASYAATVCITVPATGAAVAGDQQVAATVTFTGTAPALKRVVFYVDGVNALTDNVKPYAFVLPTERWADGSHVIEAAAGFGDGTTSQRASVATFFTNEVLTPPVNTRTFTPSAGTSPAAGAPFVMAAVGDGAGSGTKSPLVADLVTSWSPNLFLYLGDVYEQGSSVEFYNWYGTDSLWGRMRDITNPAAGNHEYRTAGAAGYQDYWDNPPASYSVDAGDWHVVSLNSNSSIAPGSTQYDWLERDLAANTNPCTVVEFHHPVRSIGGHGDEPDLYALWALMAQRGVDLVLVGHDHGYQRWKPLDADGIVTASGPVQIVVGTGGASTSAFARSDDRVAAAEANVLGGLRLELGRSGASYSFVDLAGATRDAGIIACSGTEADSTPPTTPGAVTATAAGSNRVSVSWSAATDDVGVTGYVVSRDGSDIAQVQTLTLDDDSVAPATTYSYTVSAVDAAGHRSPPSQAATATTGAAAAVSYVGSSTAVTSGASTITVPLPSGLEPGDVALASVDARGTPTVTGPSRWSLVRTDANPTKMVKATFVHVVGAGETDATFTLSAAKEATATVLGYRGVNTTSPVDQSSGQIGTSTATITAPSVTTSRDGDVLVGLFSAAVATSITPPATMTERAEIASTAGAYKVTSEAADAFFGSAGATGSRSATALTSSAWAAQLVALRPGTAPAPDTTPPTTPTGLAVGSLTSSTAALTWDAASDNLGVAGYTVYRDGAVVANTSLPSFTDSSLAPATVFTWAVDAVDAAGNHSPRGMTVSASTAAPPAASGIALHGTSGGGNGSGSTSITLSRPAGSEAGDVLFCSIDVRGKASASAPGWTLLRDDVVGTTLRKMTWYRVVGPSEPVSYTWRLAKSVVATGVMLAYGGVSTTAPIDATSAGLVTSASGTFTAPSVTGTASGDAIVVLVGAATAAAVAPPVGMAEQAEITAVGSYSVTSEVSVGSLLVAGPTGSRTALVSPSTRGAIQLLLLRPAT